MRFVVMDIDDFIFGNEEWHESERYAPSLSGKINRKLHGDSSLTYNHKFGQTLDAPALFVCP